jgi:hypothetical protein
MCFLSYGESRPKIISDLNINGRLDCGQSTAEGGEKRG